jgi:hypothetical protein
MALLTSIAAEFRGLIATFIPHIRELAQKPHAAFGCANSPHAAFYFFRSGGQRVLFGTPSDAPEQKKK